MAEAGEGNDSELPLMETRQTELVSPELSIRFDKAVLASLAERYPDQQEMFDRFGRLPPIDFKPGTVNFIFGPNGSGKSTLANAIFLAASIQHRAGQNMDSSAGLTGEEAQKAAKEQILHPSTMQRAAVVELVGMASAPRLVEDNALVLTQFQARKGYGSGEPQVLSDTPVVHRIAVQELLGEERGLEEDYRYDNLGLSTLGTYSEHGASARQRIETRLKLQFDNINPGSIVIIDEAAFGLSPNRQEGYIRMLEQLAQEKGLIIIAPENSGFAYESATSVRIDLEEPERGLHFPEVQEGQTPTGPRRFEAQEQLPAATVTFAVDHDKLNVLAGANERFRPMLQTLARLPRSFGFGPGKTEIFADNGGGKTTMLGVMYLLMQVEERVYRDLELWGGDPETLRRKALADIVAHPSQPLEQVFIESLGFASELITSGAITLESRAYRSPQDTRILPENLRWMNLLDVSGEISSDNFRIIGHSNARDISSIQAEIDDLRPDRPRGSTRQTSETLLLRTIEDMPEGGFLFVDEIDGGVSPGRQLHVSSRVHQLARERGITVIATSNSYGGYTHRITPSLDLFAPEQGVIPPTHALAQAA